MRRSMPLRLSVVIVILVGALSGVPAALGMQQDRNPLEVFDHLAQQHDELAGDIEAAGAELVETSTGGFEVRGPDIGTSTWHNGAQRPLSPDTVNFDPLDGRITFTYAEHGVVSFEPIGRDAPSSIARTEHAVTAYGIHRDLSEFTVASHTMLEQHLVVDSRHAHNKLIEWGYRVVPPAGATVEFVSGQLTVRAGAQVLVAMRADYAMDEAGTRFPVTMTFDADTSIATVSYDGRALTPAGDVAIDPVFLSDDEVGLFVMKVCQGPGGSVCDVQPTCAESPGHPCDSGQLPPGVGGSALGNFRLGAAPEWGMYVSALAGDFATGHYGKLIYTPPTDTKIRKVVFHGRIDDASRQFSCRVEVLKGNAVHGTPGPWFTVLTDQSNRIVQTEAVSPAGVDGDQAALRLQTTGAATTVPNDHGARCWMPDASVGANDETVGDRFTAYVKDEFAPTVSADPDLPNPNTDALNVVNDVSAGGPSGALVTSEHQYNTNRWYRNGSKVSFMFLGEDRGSGLYGFRVRHVAASEQDGQMNAMGRIGTCPIAAHNTSGPPCPLAPGLLDAQGFLNATNSVRQGLNPYWVIAEDFSGRSVRSAPLYYLYDDVAPNLPTPTFGSTLPSTAPVKDVKSTSGVRLEWNDTGDPGAATTGHRTGSGVSHYVAQIQWVQNNAWVPFTANPEVVAGDTDPMTLGTPPTHLDIDAKAGLFRYRVKSVDRAGNETSWNDADYRYFWVDTSEPLIQMTRPTVGFEVDVRKASEPPAMSFQVSDPIIPGAPDPVIDLVGAEYRLDGTSNWHQYVDRAGLGEGAFNSGILLPGSGLYDVRGYTRDGEHDSHGGQAWVCADVSITQSDINERALEVEYFPFFDDGVQYATIVRFRSPAASTKARAWIVERREGPAGPWRLAGREVTRNMA